MNNDKFVTINGQRYNAATGLPIAKPANQPKPIHSIAQRSKAITPKGMTAVKAPAGVLHRAPKTGRSMDISRSKKVSRFAPKLTPTTAPTSPKKKQMDIGPIKHPLAAKVESVRALRKIQSVGNTVSKTAKAIKEEVIAEALGKTSDTPGQKKSIFKRHYKFINIFSISLVLIIIAGYFTYQNMPSLSVRVASAQAGIDATYPNYHPDGYSIDGPVVYSDGQVSIKFRANTGNRSFVIKQAKSTWDSSAVKNQIDKQSVGGTSESQERGLTIFSYNNNTKAAWVNGGILYSISGNAPLSGEQIRHIATSLIDK